MNMTPEQKTQWLNAAQAVLDGEPIEYQPQPGVWYHTNNITGSYPHRRKPKPDPFAEIKAAHAAGKRLQFRKPNENWRDWNTTNALEYELRVPGYEWRILPKLFLVSEDGGETWKKTEEAK
jgi:hypothetical protein